jgi:hypothetical protein
MAQTKNKTQELKLTEEEKKNPILKHGAKILEQRKNLMQRLAKV